MQSCSPNLDQLRTWIDQNVVM